MSFFCCGSGLGERVFEAAFDPMFICNNLGEVCAQNGAAMAQFGINDSEASVGASIADLLTISPEIWQGLIEVAGSGESVDNKAPGVDHKVEACGSLLRLTSIGSDRWLVVLRQEQRHDHFGMGSIGLIGSNIPSDLVINALRFKSLYMAEEVRANTDSLTGLQNRRSFENALALALETFSVESKPFSLVILDVDHFKRFNDTHGHLTGDAVLKGLATLLKSKIRSLDSIHRIGGEEFVILLAEADQQLAMDIANRIRASVEETAIAGLKVTISLGVVTCSDASWNGESLVQAADMALYSSKGNGRNKVTHYSSLPVEDQIGA